jgi:thymidylate kinase
MSIPVISLCGLDGVGKTSILHALDETEELRDVFCVDRGPDDTESTVEKHYPRSGGLSDWIKGDFNRAIATGCAIDYVAYYHAIIAPVLPGTDNTGRRYRAIVTDRHTPCFKAFTMLNDSPSRTALALLSSVPDPDFIINITLDREEIKTRHGATPGADYEFESDHCQEKLLLAYQEVFKSMDRPVYTIQNNTALDVTVDKIADIINEVANGR